MSLKDNFNQAVKEILRKDGLVGDDLSRESRKRSEVDRFMGEAIPHEINESLTPDMPDADDSYGTDYTAPSAAPSAEDFRNAVHNARNTDPFSDESHAANNDAYTEPEYTKFEYSTADDTYTAPSSQPQQSYGFGSTSSQGMSGLGGAMAGMGMGAAAGMSSARTGGSGGGYNPPRNPMAGASFRGGRPPETPYYETEETTVISRNTRISGDISSFANVTVEGSVQGDIKLTKNISVSGKVVGNIECNNAVMAGAQMQGSISSKGQVQMDHDSVLLGNIDTQYLDLNGRIKGNVDVGGKAEFKNDAVIVGDITASTISVIDGAVIKGYVNTTFMQESTSNVFPEAISVGEV